MFHVDLPTDTQVNRNYYLITVRLLFIHKTIGRATLSWVTAKNVGDVFWDTV